MDSIFFSLDEVTYQGKSNAHFFFVKVENVFLIHHFLKWVGDRSFHFNMYFLFQIFPKNNMFSSKCKMWTYIPFFLKNFCNIDSLLSLIKCILNEVVGKYQLLGMDFTLLASMSLYLVAFSFSSL